MGRKIKKILAIGLCAAMIIMMCTTGFASTDAVRQPSDIGNHWAESQIKNWVERGFIRGYTDNTFRPDASITRAEFVTIVNNLFGYKDKSTITFSDVKAGDWFYDQIEKAREIGYISGYTDGTMRPNNPITRQEAMVIICNILRFEQSSNAAAISGFNDRDDIPDWSRGFIITAVEKGFISGYEDKTIRGNMPIKRAETVAMLDKVAGEIVNASGNSGPSEGTRTIAGNMTVSTNDVVLRNTVIEGDLYLTEGIGEGDVTLSNVTVKGNTLIAGGGENSIIIKDSNLSNVNLIKKNGKIRIQATGETKVDSINLKSGAKLETQELTGQGFAKVNISEKANVDLSGDFHEVNVLAKDSVINVTYGSIKTLDVKVVAEINLAENVEITTLKAGAVIAVKGEGTVKTAEINVNGVSFDTRPENIVAKDGVTEIIVAGSKDDISDKDDSTPPTQADGGSGGSGGGGGSTPTPSPSPSPQPVVGSVTITTSAENNSEVPNNETVIITMETETVGAVIYYTLDGEEPDTDTSDVYDPELKPIVSTSEQFGETKVVRAIAVMDDMNDSSESSQNIVFIASPTVTVASAADLVRAIENNHVETINIDDDITGNVTATRTDSTNLTINFGTFALTGSLAITANNASVMTFNGSATPAITGNLTVSAANGTVFNNIDVGLQINVVAISSNTWNQNGDADRIIITSNGGAFRREAGTIAHGLSLNPSNNTNPLRLRGNVGQIPVIIQSPAKVDIDEDVDDPPSVTVEEDAEGTEIENYKDEEITITANANIVVGGQADVIKANDLIIVTTRQVRPSFNPTSGAVLPNSAVTITSSGATSIFYTLNGTEPATEVGDSTLLYDGGNKPTVNPGQTIKAIAVNDDPSVLNSSISTAVYTAPVMGGAVTIDGVAKYGETLTADIDGLTYTPATGQNVPTYQWTRNTVEIEGATSLTYQLVQEDIGKRIRVIVTADGTNAVGSVRSEATVNVVKADGPAAPSAPTLASKTDTTIVLNVIAGAQYKIDDGSWQDSPEFTGLDPVTEYTFRARIKETATHFASLSSSPTSITTEATVVSISEISGIEVPVFGEVPVEVITESDEFTGTVTWDPDDNPFEISTVYTATITLVAKPGFTFTGVMSDFFEVEGADSVSNEENSGIVTAVFPATGVPAQSGSPAFASGIPATFGEEITVGEGTLSTTTNLTYTWYRSEDDTLDESDTEVATGTTYTPVEADIENYLIVEVTTDDASGEGIVVTDAVVAKAENTQVATIPTLEGEPTKTSITLTELLGHEYTVASIDQTPVVEFVWQSSNIFTGLDEYTAYTFKSRIAETATHLASDPSDESDEIFTASGEPASFDFEISPGSIVFELSDILDADGHSVNMSLVELSGNSLVEFIRTPDRETGGVVSTLNFSFLGMDKDTLSSSVDFAELYEYWMGEAFIEEFDSIIGFDVTLTGTYDGRLFEIEATDLDFTNKLTIRAYIISSLLNTLDSLITDSTYLKDSIPVGEAVGQAPQAAHDNLQTVIDLAELAYDDLDPVILDVSRAVRDLEQAMHTFVNSIVSQSITITSTVPVQGTAGEETIVNVSISSISIPDGTTVELKLRTHPSVGDEIGTTATGIINSDSALVSFTVPDTTLAGKYYFVASVGDVVSDARMFILGPDADNSTVTPTTPISPFVGEQFAFVVSLRDAQNRAVTGLGLEDIAPFIKLSNDDYLNIIEVTETESTGDYMITASYDTEGTFDIDVGALFTAVGSIEGVVFGYRPLTIADLGKNHYAAGETITFTISGLPVDTEVIIHMPIFVGGDGSPWASDLNVLDILVEDQGIYSYTGTTNQNGDLIVTGVVQADLPYGQLHVTVSEHGITIDNAIQLQKDGQPVFVGQSEEVEVVIYYTPQAMGALPTSVVTVQIDGVDVPAYTLKFDGISLATATDSEVVVATAVLSNPLRLIVSVGDEDYTVDSIEIAE
ncbi:UNVERIFIED_CONTAM: chitobiase/beta-hexosaminidase-like protein [Acetivibrio alkalicellulosi]